MKLSASLRELPVFFDSVEARESPPEAGEGIGLGALLVMLVPIALAAWFAIGVVVYRVIT
jgi:hypothetical protein